MKRGEIYYIFKGSIDSIDNEMQSGRPGIIVSNDLCNSHSPVVEVVYLTTQPKNELPTHTPITSSPRESIALCEQIQSVAVSRIGEYIGTLTESEMESLNNALLVSLGLPTSIVTPKTSESEELIKLRTERDTYEKILNNLLKGQVK